MLGYDFWRSQSGLRIATTASPISGSEVRERMVKLADESSHAWAEAHIAAQLRSFVGAWFHWQAGTYLTGGCMGTPLCYRGWVLRGTAAQSPSNLKLTGPF